jgi:hypothetical protein
MIPDVDMNYYSKYEDDSVELESHLFFISMSTDDEVSLDRRYCNYGD